MGINNAALSPGTPLPYGASLRGNGINFSIFSLHAESITLCLYDVERKPIGEVPLANRTGTIWHVHIDGLAAPLYYAYRVSGPKTPFSRFDEHVYLLDPYAKAIASSCGWGESGEGYAPLGAVVPPSTFDWQGVQAPRYEKKDLVIYEAHVRGFTQHDSAHATHPGTFLGMVEKIPHLKAMGINAVELLPLMEFNQWETKFIDPETGKYLPNYWGYSTVNFFTAMNRYCTSDAPGAVLDEFKTLVRELHRNGIEVILDVVYNHTAEGDDRGSVLSFKGIDNAVYYIMDPDGKFSNYSGTGNTFNANYPVVTELILNSLRWWAMEMHVDGFRFDLASSLTRGLHGEPLEKAPLIQAIQYDPLLAGVKLFSEPWDAVGLYQVGHFGGSNPRWSEWNGKYRDIVRRFIHGTPGTKGEFITRIFGSEDLYYNRSPLASLNFVTVHDGFTLHDLVSYNQKHNKDNGENNADGSPFNDSWNCGVEGETDDAKVIALRQRQMRNFHFALLLSFGVPLLLMGDEYGHTKRGNNNTWCQDNELNWFLWNELDRQGDFFRFYSAMIRFRKAHHLIRRDRFLTPEDAQWHGVEPFKPNWESHNHFIAYTLIDKEEGRDLYIAFNSGAHEARPVLPPPPQGKRWHWVVHTGNTAPQDFYETPQPYADEAILMQGYSAILLEAL